MKPRVQASKEAARVGEDRQLVTGDHVEPGEFGVEEARRPGRGDHDASIDRLDVAERSGELRFDLGLARRPHRIGCHFVDHRVPDGPGELEPVGVDRSVGRHRNEIVEPAVVLVEQAGRAVVDDERRVAAGPVGERGLDVDLDREAAEVDGLAVLGVHERAKAERP